MDLVKKVLNYIFGNPYLRFLFITLVSLLLAWIVRIIMHRVLKPLAQKTKTHLDDILIRSIASASFYFVFFLGVKVGLDYLQPPSAFYQNLIESALVVVVTVMVLKIIDSFTSYWLNEWKDKTKSSIDERLLPLVKKILKVVTVLLGIFFLLNAWNVNISPLLTTAGIAGIAISLAVKDSLTNILGGIQLVLDKTFKVGDKVQLDSGEMGIILDIGLRSTKLKTFDNEVIYIPNGALANAKIKNFTQPDLSVRVNVNFGVEYGSDPEKVRQVVLEAISRLEGVLADPPPDVQFLQMSDFSLDFVARVWVASYTEAFKTKLKLTEEVYRALNAAGIGIPFPTRTIYTKALD